MLRILKNNWNLLMNQKNYLILSLIMTICSVGAAILITNNVEIKSNIAVVADEQSEKNLSTPYFHITFLDKEPPMSELVQNRYDAVVIPDGNGGFQIKTIKSDDLKKELQKFLDQPSDYAFTNNVARKIGTNILGYMMMFLLMQGVLYARFFAEDKEKHRIERVSMSPIPFVIYLFGHALFMWLLIFVPSFMVVCVTKLFGISIGFSIPEYMLLIGVLAFLSVAYALFINSFFCVVDTANMLASSIVVLTSILAGSFYSFSKQDSLFNKFLHIFPQKDFMNFSDAFEKGNITFGINLQFCYIIMISLLMFTIAVVKTRRSYLYKR
jgi:ABC-2 type transport system permease protein